MAKVNLKENIWIEGFDCTALLGFWGEHYSRDLDYEILYYGKTSEIPEKLAKECVDTLPEEISVLDVDDYPVYDDCSNIFEDYSKNHKWIYDSSGICYYGVKTAKESIQSACSEEYCIIYKEE